MYFGSFRAQLKFYTLRREIVHWYTPQSNRPEPPSEGLVADRVQPAVYIPEE